MKKTIERWVALVMVGAFVAIGSAAQAQTPDYETPAEETVCDLEAAPGRGLCVAFCEAMDCDDDPNANQTACDRVKGNWQKKTGGTDLPCEISCPCNDIPPYAALSSGAVPAVACSAGGPFDEIYLLNSNGFRASVSLSAVGCAFFGPGGGILPLTPEEMNFCYVELEAQAAAQGIPCNPI